MARFDGKVEVTLSATDRQLLRDIRDALRAMGVEAEDEDSAAGAVQRLVEYGPRSATPTVGGTTADEWYSKGYTWNGSGWVPKV